MIKKSKILYFILTLYLIFPIVISFIFNKIGINMPTYLFVFFIIILFIISSFYDLSTVYLKFKLPLFFFYFLLFWIVISYYFSISIIAKDTKLILLVYDIIIPIFLIGIFASIGTFTFSNRIFELYLLRYSYVIIWVIFLFFLFFSLHDESGRYFLPGSENSILFSRNISALLIILYFVKHRINFFLKYLTILLCLIMLFASSSKGPMVALLLIMVFIYNKRSNSLSILKNLYFAVIIIFVLLVVSFIDKENYLFDTNFYSLYARQSYLQMIFDNLNFNIFTGVGIGSFSLIFMGEDTINYPHNIFIELFIEYGLLGLSLFIIMIIFFIKNYQFSLIYLLAIFYFISAQFSGDIPGNNYMFILYFLLFLTKPDRSLKFISIEN